MSERHSNPKVEYSQRYELANPYLMSAYEHAKSVDNPKVTEVLAFLEDFDIREPIAKDGKSGFSGRKGTDAFGFVPLVASDGDIHAYFRENYEKKPAHYSEGARTIFFNTDTISTQWGGIVLIHEGLHALAHKNNWWRDKPGDWSQWYEEYQIYTVEHEIMRAEGGEEYEQAVAMQAEHLRSLLKEQKLSMKTMSHTPEIEKVLAIFQRKDTPHERGMIIGGFNLQCYFYLLDGGFKRPENVGEHLFFTRWSHDAIDTGGKPPDIPNTD